MCRSRWIDGIATLTIATSRIVMKNAAPTTVRTSHLFVPSRLTSSTLATLRRVRLGVALGLLAALVAAATATAAAPPTPWCGPGESSVDRPDAVPAFQIHVVYALPTDGDDRFAQLVSLIDTDEATIDLWWRGQDPTRTPRFDLAAFAGCASTFGRLDVSFVRLPGTAAAYGADQFHLLRRDLDADGFRDPDKKY